MNKETVKINRPGVRCLAVVLAFCTVLGVGAAPVVGKVVHNKVGSFNGSDTPGGPFGLPVFGEAVDQASGDVWVMETDYFGFGRGVVDKFTGGGVYAGVQITGVGTPQGAFALGASAGLAVDSSGGATKGDVYVADSENGVIDRFNAAGEYLCQITAGSTPSATECESAGSGLAMGMTPVAVAVGAGGVVYVADDTHEAIYKFGAAGKLEGEIKDPHLSGEMSNIAVDPAGHLYVISSSVVVDFDAAGTFVSVLDANPSFGVAVDPNTSRVFVADYVAPSRRIAEYEPPGALVAVTPTEGYGLAVDGTTGKVYATEPAYPTSTVSILGPDTVVPDVTTGTASGITETSATVGGHLDLDASHGGGEVTECEFEYGPTASYGQIVSCSPGAPYAGATDVSADITGLTHSSVYHFRLKAANVTGSNVGEDGTLTTAGAPAIDSEVAHVNGRNVVFRAQINPFHLDTACQVQYVDDAGFQRSGYAGATTLPCTPENLGSGFGDRAARASVDGLKVGTTYHYRFLASNQGGLVGRPDQTFSTFGASNVKFEIIDKEGLPFTQAGGHPYELATSFHVNSFLRGSDEISQGGAPGADGNVKDILTELPAGFIGDPSATPKCTRRQLSLSLCSGAAQVGWIIVNLEGESEGRERFGIYNLVPPKGVAVEFGASILGEVNVYIDSKLRTGGDYGVTAESPDATAIAALSEAILRFWGVPADPSHDSDRFCPNADGSGQISPCSAEEPVLKPLLRNPTSCGGPLTTTFALDSWQNPGEFADTSVQTPAVTGCGKVPFTPSLQAQPSSSAADSPTGLHVDLHLPQNREPEGLGEADLREARVMLPEGVIANPSAGTGLEGCSPGQIGLTSAAGVTPVTFTPDAASCPDGAKVGTVEVDTPLLDHPLTGAVYLATPHQNPFGSLIAVYIAVADPQTGVVVKLPGRVEADPRTGQLTTVFSENPQVPFEDFKLDFFGGPRASLATPQHCGTFTTSAALTSWSASTPVSSTEPFSVTTGCGNRFAPSLTAGTTNPQAGGYAPFALSLSRSDGEQDLAGLSVSLPQGLLGKIAGIPLCPEANANAGTCPEASRVGSVQTSAGSGPDPLSVSGKAFLTGPYNGGPYGLAVEVPAVAGPFDLGTVVVRQSIRIDPHTARVTAVSDPLPTILQGIPLRVRRVDVTLDRPGFTFNPTSCDPTAVTAAVTSTEGATANVSSRFQAGGCASLGFKPKFTVATQGNTSKKNGASLTVKVGYPKGAQANIRSVAVTLPKQLPARLTTLQQACPQATFDANPATCPAGSNVGTATASTPVLASPVTGPAFLVSHGGAAFPDLVVVLQGEGVTIDLVGNTNIKKQITSSTFASVPDAPIAAFALTLPEGGHSALTTNLPAKARGNLCGQSLTMPTTIMGQNGAVVKQTTKIQVTGCPKPKKKTRGGKRRVKKKKS